MAKKLRICETVLRDGHQSILATRMRYEQMELLNVGAALLMIAVFVS